MSERVNSGPRFPAGAWLDVLLDASLSEDVGDGDVTTDLSVAPTTVAEGEIAARSAGVVAGLPILAPLFARLDDDVHVDLLAADGDRLAPGQSAARLHGPAAAILTGERTALNFLQHLSGVATLVARYVDAVAGTGCQILDTRKTLPGYRALAKYAVRCGGGANHRMGLYDRILLKDNHWASRDASLAELVARGRDRYPDLAIEVEVDSLDQLREVLPLGVEWILLDNFTPAVTREAVRLRASLETGDWRTRFEASGNVTLETIRDYAEAGVDAASVGRLTHSVPALDLGLDLRPGKAT
jgi:nicotinate-nucleotide pyrophosphorylase (carboxylating)